MDFEDILHELFDRLSNTKPTPRSNNPADYDRSTKITDENIIARIWALDAKSKELRSAADYARVLSQEVAALKDRMFYELRRHHPDIADETAGVGYRQWEGDYYFVGWIHERTASTP